MAVDGLITGLDTSSLIEQLMKIERIPQNALAARQAKVKAAAEAQASIRTKLTAVSAAAAALATPSKWDMRTATSSASSVATVSATSTASTGSLTFTVDQLAAAHAVRSGEVIPATDATIASSGTIDIDLGDEVRSIDVGGGTLSEVVSAINSAGLRVRAAAVNVGDGYRLQITSTTSGASSEFSVSGLDASVGGTVAVQVGRDATLTIGSGPGAYSITSASNTFSNVLNGVSITAVSTSTTPVTVNVSEDPAGLAKKVQELVDAANAALLEISTRTAYDSATRTSASLAGDSTARRAAQELTRALSDIVGNGYASVGQVGLKLERTGRFSFDASAFQKAYEKDPAAVRSLFAQSAAVELSPSVTAGSIQFISAGNRAAAGTYEVEVTREAEKASATSPAAVWPSGVASSIGLRIGSTTVLVELTGAESADQAADAIRNAVQDAGLSVDVSTDGSSVTFTTREHGSGSKFEVAWDGSTWETHQGVDIEGTIGGVAATGVGRQLTVPPITPGLGGISVLVTAAGVGNLGSVTYTPGAAQRVSSALSRALDTIDGYLTTAEKGNETRRKTLQDSIDAFEVRLEKREARLRQYYSNLEVALSSLQQQSSWLAGQVAGLYANS